MGCFFFFSSRRRHTRWTGDWSSDVCSSDLRILVRKIEFRKCLADQRYRWRGREIRFIEQTATKQWNSHHGEIVRAGWDVISGVGRSRLPWWIADNLKGEGDTAIHHGQRTRDGRILHPGLGRKTHHQFFCESGPLFRRCVLKLWKG